MSGRPKVIVIAGPNGAGKSTTAPEIVRTGFGVHEFVNADTIARGLSEFAPEQVAFSAGRIFLSRIRELEAEKVSFAFETTLATRSFLPMLKRMQKSGYEVHIIFLWLPAPEMAMERVEARVQKGGHSVPAGIVRRRYFRGLENFFNFISANCRFMAHARQFQRGYPQSHCLAKRRWPIACSQVRPVA